MHKISCSVIRTAFNHSGDTTALEDVFGNYNWKLRSRGLALLLLGRVDDLAAMANDGETHTANSQGKSGYSMMNMTG